jgi:hypothetical protein
MRGSITEAEDWLLLFLMTGLLPQQRRLKLALLSTADWLYTHPKRYNILHALYSQLQKFSTSRTPSHKPKSLRTNLHAYSHIHAHPNSSVYMYFSVTCVCMCACMFVHISLRTNLHACSHDTHIQIQACICMILLRVCACVHVCLYIFTYVLTHAHTRHHTVHWPMDGKAYVRFQLWVNEPC